MIAGGTSHASDTYNNRMIAVGVSHSAFLPLLAVFLSCLPPVLKAYLNRERLIQISSAILMSNSRYYTIGTLFRFLTELECPLCYTLLLLIGSGSMMLGKLFFNKSLCSLKIGSVASI